MKTQKIWTPVLLLVVLGCSGAAMAQQPEPRLEDFVESWLMNTCDVGEETSPEAVLQQFGARAEPLLIEALENGPGTQLLQGFRAGLTTRWQARQALLSNPDLSGLGPQELAQARARTQDEYVSRETDSFVTRYRDRAVYGLSLVGSQSAIEALNRVAGDQDSPLSQAARQAVESIRSRIR